jgi:hypothetical protein
MPCNYSGDLDPANVANFGIVDIDWSQGQATWAKQRPMMAEESMLDAATKVKAANPETHVMLYRNRVKAHPFFSEVRAALEDPAYSRWFVPFGSSSNLTVPRCDNNWTPPLCSDLYHFPDGPQLDPPPGQGSMPCAQPNCDCGKVPCGGYIYDWRNADLYLNGSLGNMTLLQFFVNRVVLGPTALGAPDSLVQGLFLDDWWLNGAPTEVDPNFQSDAGLSRGDMVALTRSFAGVQETIYDAVVSAGGFLFQLFAPWTWWSICPQPLIHRNSCAKDLQYYAGGTDGASLVSFTDMAECQFNSSWPTAMPNLEQDIANFLLIRAEYAWLGAAWGGCGIDYGKTRSPLIDADYGEPLGWLNESSPGVFTREWTKATVSMDCSTWTPSFSFKGA